MVKVYVRGYETIAYRRNSSDVYSQKRWLILVKKISGRMRAPHNSDSRLPYSYPCRVLRTLFKEIGRQMRTRNGNPNSFYYSVTFFTI